ncbi:Hypothetical protein PHPALM_37805 [Phytophthora palmivora]|uniref:Uncharacterized protein n=1 Tax=Phytophthora palmivora TaxID=4796 RepID=A0A2P4WWH8_9STRA|nr:Hypothetical protein PHPALM_37805 [Phytophthora palmivora]
MSFLQLLRTTFLLVTMLTTLCASSASADFEAASSGNSTNNNTSRSLEEEAIDYYSAMLSAVNRERTSRGLPKLCKNSKLQKAAQAHSADMARRNFLSHTGSDGSTMASRVQAAGYRWTNIAENIAAGQTTVSSVMSTWMKSSGHRANILSTKNKMFGCSYAYSANSNSTALFAFLVVTLFGSTVAIPKPIIGTAVAVEVPNSTVTRELQTYSATGFQTLMLNAVNKQRTAYGLSKLCTNKKLQTASQGHSNDMAAKNYMSHTGSDGSTMSQRITAAGYKWSACAENVAAGQTTVDAVVTAWMASSGHRANILSTKYTMLGVGYAYKSGTTYKHYWTQDFGNGSTEKCSMHTKSNETDTSVEEQVQLRRVFRLLAFDTPLGRLEQKIEKLSQNVKSPERQVSRGRNTKLEQDTKREHYVKEKLKFLATLQDEVNLGRELVSSKYQIDTKALLAIYEQLGYPLSGQEKSRLEEVIWQVNDNLDGAICFEEFVNSYVRSRNDRSGLEPSEIFFLTCFLMLDKECCGRISLDDAMGILYMKYGEAMEREMEIHFGKLLDEGAHFVTFVEYTLPHASQMTLEDRHINVEGKISMRWGIAGLFIFANVATESVANAQPSPLSPNLFDEWRAGYRVRDIVREEPLEDQLARYTREGRFPKAGRSLQEKIDEANEFLDRELAIEEQRGVGVSGAIVYQDKVVLSKGYGLRKSDDPSSKVTNSTLFQIGSVSKTFISFGIAILVEEGKLSWDDPVKNHLPSFQLYDKYAEKYATIGDLCAMNSGLNDLPDFGLFFGIYPTDEEQVANLGFIEPAHSLRGGHDYANANFAVLGQVIKSVSGKSETMIQASDISSVAEMSLDLMIS